MATYVQSYKGGFIAREGDKYQYNVKGEVVGSYNSVEELVAAQTQDGKQNQEPKSSAQEQPATKPTRKTATKTKGSKK